MNKIFKILKQFIKLIPNIIFILGMIGFVILNIFAAYNLGKVLISDVSQIDIGKGDMVNKYYRFFEWIILTSIYIYVFIKMYKGLFKNNLPVYKKYLIIFICILMVFIYLIFPWLSLLLFNVIY